MDSARTPRPSCAWGLPAYADLWVPNAQAQLPPGGSPTPMAGALPPPSHASHKDGGWRAPRPGVTPASGTVFDRKGTDFVLTCCFKSLVTHNEEKRDSQSLSLQTPSHRTPCRGCHPSSLPAGELSRTSGSFSLRVRLSVSPRFIRVFPESYFTDIVRRHNEKPGPCLPGPVASGTLEAGPKRRVPPGRAA